MSGELKLSFPRRRESSERTKPLRDIFFGLDPRIRGDDRLVLISGRRPVHPPARAQSLSKFGPRTRFLRYVGWIVANVGNIVSRGVMPKNSRTGAISIWWIWKMLL